VPDRLDAELDRLAAALDANEGTAVRAAWREAFDCRDGELDVLLGCLRPSGILELYKNLEQIRRAPARIRPTLAFAIPLVLANNRAAGADTAAALAVARAVIERFPDRPRDRGNE
jgi:hypothetical protein